MNDRRMKTDTQDPKAIGESLTPPTRHALAWWVRHNGFIANPHSMVGLELVRAELATVVDDRNVALTELGRAVAAVVREGV